MINNYLCYDFQDLITCGHCWEKDIQCAELVYKFVVGRDQIQNQLWKIIIRRGVEGFWSDSEQQILSSVTQTVTQYKATV